jgi:hypothetical protein
MLPISTIKLISPQDLSINFCQPGCTGGTGGAKPHEKNTLEYGPSSSFTDQKIEEQETEENTVESGSENRSRRP